MRSASFSTQFQPYLLTGEHMLWSGQPKQGLALGPRDALLIPFSLLWGGFAIFWNVGVWAIPTGGGEGAPLFFKLWGLPFLVVGLYFIIGRFFHDAHIRKSLAYAVTDRRVLVLRQRKVSSIDIDRLPRLDLNEARDGTGTLQFEAPVSPFGTMNGFGLWVPAMSSAVQFFRIDRPREVYALIQREARA